VRFFSPLLRRGSGRHLFLTDATLFRIFPLLFFLSSPPIPTSGCLSSSLKRLPQECVDFSSGPFWLFLRRCHGSKLHRGWPLLFRHFFSCSSFFRMNFLPGGDCGLFPLSPEHELFFLCDLQPRSGELGGSFYASSFICRPFHQSFCDKTGITSDDILISPTLDS